MGGNDTVLTSVSGAAGIITLNRPATINALNPEMIAGVLAALAAWQDDGAVKAVIIEGEGEKGLSAGGDVRAVRELILADRAEEAFAFFAREYEMNRVIARYEKPVVALQRGVVMGGGIGISSHARFRIATPSSTFAMPEGAIGFFPDVGVNAILAEASEPRALAFLLSGMGVGVADALTLGLTDAVVDDAQLPEIRSRVIAAAEAGDIDTQIASILQAESREPGPAEFCAMADTLADAFALDTVSAIDDQLGEWAGDGDPGAAALAEKMGRLSPTSLAVALMAHRKARQDRTVEAVLARDLKLARWVCVRPDFAEGVRALLVDKDRAPRWEPARHRDVPHADIAALLD